MRYLRMLLLWCLLTAAAVTAIGCHTIDGIGQDLNEAAQTFQDLLECD